MKAAKMGGAQSSPSQVFASAVSRSLPSSDNYFVQKWAKWAADNSAPSPPVITVDDSDEDSSDDVEVVRVEPPTDVSSDYLCEITFTEPPRKSLSKKHLSRDRAKMSPYYRSSKGWPSKLNYLEMLQKHVPNYSSERVTFKRVHPKRNPAAESPVAKQLRNPITKYNVLDFVKRNRSVAAESSTIEISDDEEMLRSGSTRTSQSGEWFESFRRELDALNEAREKENGLQAAAYDRVVKNRSSLIRKPSLPAEVPPQTPPLTPEIRQRINEILKKPDSQEVLIKQFKLDITRADIDTLRGLTWLNDTVINFYLNMVAARSQVPELKLPKVYTFNTFFYVRLMKEGHQGVKRWTRRDDIFVNDLLLVPVHLEMHWCLAVVDFRKKTINYYDSMGGNNDHCLTNLLTYLQDELKDKKKQEFDKNGWTTNNLKNLPQQGNGSDCGMFACKYAEYVTRDARINFTQKDMPYFRQRMIYEIVSGKLL